MNVLDLQIKDMDKKNKALIEEVKMIEKQKEKDFKQFKAEIQATEGGI